MPNIVLKYCQESVYTYTLVCRQQSAGVPITFLLGFYVHLITRRWWEQVTNQRPRDQPLTNQKLA